MSAAPPPAFAHCVAQVALQPDGGMRPVVSLTTSHTGLALTPELARALAANLLEAADDAAAATAALKAQAESARALFTVTPEGRA